MQWKALPKEVKDRYEDKARAIAADHAAKNSNDPIVVASYPATSLPSPPVIDSRSMSPHQLAAHGG